LAAHSAHLLCLWLPGPDASHHDTELRWLSDLFPDRLWIGCALLQDTDDAALYQQLYQLACTHHLPMVACNDVHMHDPQRQPLLDVLTALRHHTTVQTLGSLRFANAERHLRPLERLRAIYPLALLQESLRIAARCTFQLDSLRYHYPREVVPEGLTPAGYLRQLVDEGAARRWPGEGMSKAVRKQVE